MSRQLGEAATVFGKNLVEIETNLHDFSKEFTSWPGHYHGSALGAMAILFSKRIRRFYVASSHKYADGFRWGSHPMVDHLWSTERVQLVHDGAEATRVEKVNAIVAHDLRVLDYVDVGCGGPDCRRKEKCLRTMISLDLAGVLDRAKTFNHPLEFTDVVNMRISDLSELSFELENLEALKQRPDKRRLMIALKKAINRYQHRQLARSLKQYGKSFFSSDEYAELYPTIEHYLPGHAPRRRAGTPTHRRR